MDNQNIMMGKPDEKTVPPVSHHQKPFEDVQSVIIKGIQFKIKRWNLKKGELVLRIIKDNDGHEYMTVAGDPMYKKSDSENTEVDVGGYETE